VSGGFVMGMDAVVVPPSGERAQWTIFNGAGAVVVDDASLETVRDYMTPERFARGWTAVSVHVVKGPDGMAELARLALQNTEGRLPTGEYDEVAGSVSDSTRAAV
jgi:hypothetical protein